MTDKKLLEEKISQYLTHLFDASTTDDIYDFLIHSKIYLEEDGGYGNTGSVALTIIVDPEVFKKYEDKLERFEEAIISKFYKITKIPISRINSFPDFHKFKILENRIVPVHTPWEEINSSQNHLLGLLRTAKEIIDFQNIGNASRMLLQNLSSIVFKSEKHKPELPNIDLSEGKFKNRLHTFIKCELTERKNKELREYAISVVTAAENSVDLANKLTHDLNAHSLMAEFCVIGTITTVSVIKLIEE